MSIEGTSRREFLEMLLATPFLPYSQGDFSANSNYELDDTLRGIYFFGWKAVNKERIDNIFRLLDQTELNTLMVDVKNVRGELFYEPKSELARELRSQAKTDEGSPRSIPLEYLVSEAKKRGTRLIARHTMFWDENLYNQRPDLRLWESERERWVDPREREVLEYNLGLIEEEAQMGFDEIVLDYIRFPGTQQFGSEDEKCEIIDRVVEEASKIVKSHGLDLGVQVFGYSALDHRKSMVGQRIETLSPNVDTVYPMVYPSHFWPGTFGFDNPSDYPYEIIERTYLSALGKVNQGTKIIPMIQAFHYSPVQIGQQLYAVDDNNIPGYVCWHPSSQYQPLLEFLTNRTDMAGASQ